MSELVTLPPLVVLAVAAVLAASPASADAGAENEFFDDFTYGDAEDPAFTGLGWTVRTESGGPGVDGARWSADHVSFDGAGADRHVTLAGSNSGTGASTFQSSIAQPQRFFEGTYATRVRFTDAPVTGPDGDSVVETFYSINQLKHDMDPSYSELDFEYVPNGGLGSTSSSLHMVTWETYQESPWQAVREKTVADGSWRGWRLLKMNVSAEEVRYYVDGVLTATHSADVAPDAYMFLKYALWFQVLDESSATPRRYEMDVDWAYYAADQQLTTTEVEATVAAFRDDCVERVDTLTPPTVVDGWSESR